MRTKGISSVILVLCSAVALSAESSATAIQTETEKLLPADGAAVDFFSWAVSISGDTALIGALYDDDNGIKSGSAYVFQRDDGMWAQQDKLLPTDGAAHDYFAIALSVSGDIAVVGATPDQELGTGTESAYVFERNGGAWTQQAKLLPNDNLSPILFGSTVSVSGPTAVIGAPFDGENGPMSGSAYVFVRDGETWTQQAKLLPLDGAEGDEFGGAVSVDGDTAVVGARRDDDRGGDTGSVYVFVRDGETWTQQAKLLPNDALPPLRFGQAVSVYADTAVIGSLGEVAAINAGAAYVFVRDDDTWTQQARLQASDAAIFDYFGLAVSISGSTAAVGAIFNDDHGSNSGAAYLFERDDGFWTERTKLLPSDGGAQDWFGWSVAVTSDTALIGALRDDDNGGESGSAYLFPVSIIFADGLESGDCSGWSFEVP